MPPKGSEVLTVGQIARRLNEPLHRVEYAIKTRSIEPWGSTGNARLFVEADVERVAEAIRDIDSRIYRGER